MSIALERMDPSGFVFLNGSAALFAVEPPDERRICGGDGEPGCCSSSSTSSIGRNSDDEDQRSSDGQDCKEDEAQSWYNGPLDMMESLEKVLPIRRGISKFYVGKSKSFTSLAEASSASSIKDVVKPENAYTRRRRNLMASNHFHEKITSFPLRGNGKGISKKPITPSRSSLALAMAISSSRLSSSCTSEDSYSSTNSRSPPRLPPLHPQTRGSFGTFAASSPPKHGLSAWRSYSVADLPQCTMVLVGDFKPDGRETGDL